MRIFIFFAYLIIGGILCYLFKVNAGDYLEDSYGDDHSTIVAIITGVFWPIAAPFTFAILFAKKKE